MEIAHFQEERTYFTHDAHYCIGIDEAGRGPLAGPVVAAACMLKYPEDILHTTRRDSQWDFVRDSKHVSAKKREEIVDFIHEHFYSGVGIVSAQTIDRMNILQATFHAMKAALGDLKRHQRFDARRVVLLIDGNQNIPGVSLVQKAVVRGDARVKSIAAASIVAKVTRDRMMCDYDKTFPHYGFAQHKGYGTKVHMEALQKYGATPIHRKSFAPVKRVCAKG